MPLRIAPRPSHCVARTRRDTAAVRGTAAILLTTAVSVAQKTGTPSPQDPRQPPRAQRQQYDPYRGMDFSGRIPKLGSRR